MAGVAVMLAPLVLGACGVREPVDPTGMNIEVNVRDVHRCSRMSPEILVADVPAGTHYFNVRLMEYGDEERVLGGGIWRNDGSGIIPEGALTQHYMGPCPPTGAMRNYAFVVSAMPSRGAQPLAVRIFRFTQQ
jgi:phosphatidylethanolamine-binding protein (PEBP) family uncharacterized protein